MLQLYIGTEIAAPYLIQGMVARSRRRHIFGEQAAYIAKIFETYESATFSISF